METFIVAFTTFVATIGPLDLVAIFAGITTNATPAQRRRMAVRGTLIGSGVLLLFAFLGEFVLGLLGISLAALRISGGILLLLIAIDLVFARSSGGVSTTEEEADEASLRNDISVFPLATPLIAGPGAMGATILLMSGARDSILGQIQVLAALTVVLGLTLALLLLANPVHRFLGVTGVQVISRVFGVLLAGLAVQFMLDGLGAANLFSSE